MRKIHIDNMETGVKLAKAVFTAEGRILLTAGVELSEKYIQKLKDNNIQEVYIEDELSEGIEVSDVVCENTRNEAKQLVKNLINNYSITMTVDIDRVKEIVNRIIDELLSSKDILVCLSDIKSVDDYTFEHSVNVCILSLVTGIGLGFSITRLKDLGIGALLHDIGKLKIPEKILKKPSSLTAEEFEEIKRHTIYGYEILKNNSKVSMISAYIAFGHHERFDGSGYPLQLKGENIHQCAKIVAVADVFDALTSDRVYRKKLRSHEVVEYITSLGKHHFDKDIVNSFIQFIALYPAGSGVVLNTKQRGLIVRVNKDFPTRPVVRILYDEEGHKIGQHYELDLKDKSHIFISGICDL